MVFSSYSFLFLFLPLTFILWRYVLQLPSAFHSLYLLFVSLFFYAIWDWHNLLVLIPSIMGNYMLGQYLQNRQNRWVLSVGILVNLGLIFVFKYQDFFLSLITQSPYDLQAAQEKIPLGISFFTFTQIAYLIDAFHRRTSPANFTKYGLFVTYFPHLIAGPLLHHKEMISQFSWPQDDTTNAKNLAQGLCFLSFGLFKKVILADRLGLIADSFYAHFDPLVTTFQQAWYGIIAYSFQLYFDFSGYSDMAIGVSLLFGIKLPMNFHSPYKATSIIDFWHRWHISLSSFLREYLYFPLGGSRKGFPRKLINLFVVMLFCGLWHGAGLTFFVWGFYHGVLLCLNHILKELRDVRISWDALSPFKTIFVFYLVSIGWIVFRSPNLEGAYQILQTAHTVPQLAFHFDKNAILLALACVICFASPNTQEIIGYMNAKPSSRFAFLALKPNGWWAFLISIVAVIAIAKIQKISPFLYFQF